MGAMKHLVIYGPEGNGKTTKAFEFCDSKIGYYECGPHVFKERLAMGRALLDGGTIIVEECRIEHLSQARAQCFDDFMIAYRKWDNSLAIKTPPFIFTTSDSQAARFAIEHSSHFELLDLTK